MSCHSETLSGNNPVLSVKPSYMIYTRASWKLLLMCPCDLEALQVLKDSGSIQTNCSNVLLHADAESYFISVMAPA